MKSNINNSDNKECGIINKRKRTLSKNNLPELNSGKEKIYQTSQQEYKKLKTDSVQHQKITLCDNISETIKESNTTREEKLNEWTISKCKVENETKIHIQTVDYNVENISMEEGWQIIEVNGLQVITQLLDDLFPTNDKFKVTTIKRKSLFGAKGIASLYTISYKLANDNRVLGDYDPSVDIYNKINTFITNYLNSPVVIDLLQRSENSECSLKDLVSNWQSFKYLIKCICSFFNHLENGVIKINELKSLTALALENYMCHVYLHCKDSLCKLTLQGIYLERVGEFFESDPICQSIEIFIMMGLAFEVMSNYSRSLSDKLSTFDSTFHLLDFHSVYNNDFELAFLNATTEFYKKMAKEKIDSCDLLTYIEIMDSVIKQEEARCIKYHLINRTKAKVNNICLEQFIVVHNDTLLLSLSLLFKEIYCNCQRSSFDLVYRFYILSKCIQDLDSSNTEYQTLNKLAKTFKDFIIEIGSSIIAVKDKIESSVLNESTNSIRAVEINEPNVIDKIIELNKLLSVLVSKLFNNDPHLVQASKDAMTQVLNTDLGDNSITNLLVTNCDCVLKGTIKINGAELEDYVTSIMEVFSHLINKDLFADLHRNCLSKRLLFKRSICYDTERSIVSKMKEMCGIKFASSLQGMLTDVVLTKDISSAFESSLSLHEWKKSQSTVVNQISFSPIVLTNSFWPKQRIINITYPTELTLWKNQFHSWYIESNKSSRLNWYPSLGEVVMRLDFKDYHYDITVMTLQAIVLLVFDNNNTLLSFHDILGKCGMDDNETLRRVLHSLCCLKYKIITKYPESKKVETTDKFRTNLNFSSKVNKFRIAMSSLDDLDNYAAKSKGHIFEDRGSVIDSCIIRLMKSRKIMSHQNLFIDVTQQIKTFQPDPKVFKQRLESLIEREFIMRDSSDNKLYTYIP